MKVLIACEFSGIVRDAFARRGHDAWSCDLLPSESGGPHIERDVLTVLGQSWDLMIGHPPCTYLAVSGARWWKGREADQSWALIFVRELMEAPIARIAIENPIGRISTAIRKPDQIIQPWQFGHGEVKATCLWLKNLPKLVPTNVVEGRTARVHREPPSADRWKNRSRTLIGIADAMAAQWGSLDTPSDYTKLRPHREDFEDVTEETIRLLGGGNYQPATPDRFRSDPAAFELPKLEISSGGLSK